MKTTDHTSSPPPLTEDVNQLVIELRRRLRTGRKMTFRDWMTNVSALLDLLD